MGFFSQWYAKKCIFEIQDCTPLGTGWDFSQDYIGIGYCGMEGATASFMIRRSGTICLVPSFFFMERIGVLHGELGTNSQQARNLFIKGSQASLLRGYFFQLGNRVGSQRTMMTSSAWWARPGIPWSHTWGLILPSHSFWSLSIGGVMGSSVVTRSCRALKSFPSQGWSPV